MAEAEIDPRILLDKLDQKLSGQEAQDIVFSLGLDWDNLPAEGKRGKLRELLEVLQRRERVNDLITLLRTSYPDVLALQASHAKRVEFLTPRARAGRQSLAQAFAKSPVKTFALLVFTSLLGFSIIWLLQSLATSPQVNRSKNAAVDSTSTSVPTVQATHTVQPALATVETSAPICPISSIAPPVSALSNKIVISATTFAMGNGEGSDMDERPSHPVTVSSFVLDQFEVTNLQYQEFFQKSSRKLDAPAFWKNDQFLPGEAYLPVVGITWDEARQYCEWTGGRLPTEAEWELACRGTDRKLFPWGNTGDVDKSNTKALNCQHPINVGSFSPSGDSPYGLADMSGNVLEYVSSANKAYPYDGSDGREDLTDADAIRIARGGSWQSFLPEASCSFRRGVVSNVVHDAIGFRCARDVASLSHN